MNPQIAPDPAGQFRPLTPIDNNRMGRQPVFEPVKIPHKRGDYDHLGLYGWTKEEFRATVQHALDSGFVENFDWDEFKKRMKAESRARRQAAN
jgi:hypothetical protein